MKGSPRSLIALSRLAEDPRPEVSGQIRRRHLEQGVRGGIVETAEAQLRLTHEYFELLAEADALGRAA